MCVKGCSMYLVIVFVFRKSLCVMEWYMCLWMMLYVWEIVCAFGNSCYIFRLIISYMSIRKIYYCVF